ncbi:MAG: hypothetical protein RIT25_494 [Planctomycetota bacterium]
MFERTIRLKRARKALREGRLEDVLRLLDDPRVRDGRSARELRQLAQDALAARLQARDVLARTLPAGASAPDPLRLVDRARGLAAAGDVAGAALQFDRLRREAPMLRTVLHDMNRELARAQGLEGGFLLRVDEGGEHLVLRTESFSIGNLREGRADLPLLANLATRHARIERCMSFHGGMEDRIHAEDGELRVAGAPCASHRLVHGDVATLGGLRIRYELPSRRSLTARLRLLGGFMVAGTDSVLLLKDRGRDGRILLGRARDAHVVVAGARAEVEVHGGRDGQLVVRCEAGGTVDGSAFTLEHPVVPGAVVEAGGITFVLAPWRRP